MKTALIIAAAMIAAPASAADFTFDVPVHLENVPLINSITVTCIVSRADPFNAGPLSVIGRAFVVLPVSGPMDQTVPVEVNNTGAFPSSDARTYRCDLTARGMVEGAGADFIASPDNFADIYQRVSGQTLTTTVSRVVGSVR